MSEYSIFKPKSARGIFVDYPELRKNPAFKHLDNDQMLFVWYFACESSPLAKMARERDRVQDALNMSYKKGEKMTLNQEEVKRMLAGKFTDKIQVAIEAMQKYRVGPRVRAKMMIEKGFDNMEKILDIDAGNASHFTDSKGEVDFSKKKAYVDTLANASKIMPSLINQLESGFAISDDQGDDSDFDGESLIDNYHENID